MTSRWEYQKVSHYYLSPKTAPAGAYALWRKDKAVVDPVVYISSEGQAGRVAADFEEAVALIIAMPYWMGVLKFSNNGDLKAMRRAAKGLEKSFQTDWPDIDQLRQRLITALDIRPLADPVKTLRREAVLRQPAFVPQPEEDDGVFHSLVGDFIWKKNTI